MTKAKLTSEGADGVSPSRHAASRCGACPTYSPNDRRATPSGLRWKKEISLTRTKLSGAVPLIYGIHDPSGNILIATGVQRASSN